jgi:hypothetical protein
MLFRQKRNTFILHEYCIFMKKQVFVFLLLFAFTGSSTAQKITGIKFAYFLSETTPADSIGKKVAAGGYTGTLVDESFVSENPKTAAALISLIKKLKANGSDDINKCFIPRHCITLMNGDKILYRVLVCFECDGIRFSNEGKTTKIKNVGYREKAMTDLKKYFTQFHFNTKGL